MAERLPTGRKSALRADLRTQILDFLDRRSRDENLRASIRNTEMMAEHLGIPGPAFDRIWTELEIEELIARGPPENQFVPTPAGLDVLHKDRNLPLLKEFLSKNPVGAENSIVFLVGAGASAPPPTAIPVTSHLLTALWQKGRKLGKPQIDALEDWCRRAGITNIEDVLTAAYLSDLMGRDRPVLELVKYLSLGSRANSLYANSRYFDEEIEIRRLQQAHAGDPAQFQDTLGTLFSLLTATMIEAEPNAVHRNLVQISRKYPKSTIITTNYDGCLDEVATIGGGEVDYGISDATPGAGALRLVKMHGSINWAYCESCQYVFSPSIAELKQAHQSETGFGILGICRHCGGQRKPMIVPPLKFKYVAFPPLLRVWRRAQEILEKADVIVAVGYSFSDADDYIMKMVLRALGRNHKKSVIIVNKDSAALTRVRDRVGRHMEEYDTGRIVGLLGDAVETLGLLASELGVANGHEGLAPSPIEAPKKSA